MIAGLKQALALCLVTSCFYCAIIGCRQERSESNKPDLLPLVKSWRHADGEGAFIVANQLFDAMIRPPDAFFAVMQSDTSGFSRFVDDLQYTVFTNQNDTVTSGLEMKRVDAIRLLQDSNVRTENVLMLKRMIRALEAVRPRSVG